MTALGPPARIAILERELHSAHRELHWANFTIQKRDAQIRLLEQRLRQRRIQALGPQAKPWVICSWSYWPSTSPAPRGKKWKPKRAASRLLRNPRLNASRIRDAGPCRRICREWNK